MSQSQNGISICFSSRNSSQIFFYWIAYLVYDPLHLESLEDVGAVADAVLHDQDEDGDERQDEHVQRVHALPEPRAQVHLVVI